MFWLGGLVGMGVDAATGAAQDHKPNPVIVTLQPVGRSARPAEAAAAKTAATAAELSRFRWHRQPVCRQAVRIWGLSQPVPAFVT